MDKEMFAYTLTGIVSVIATAWAMTRQGPEPVNVIDIQAKIPQPVIVASAAEYKDDEIISEKDARLIAKLVTAEAEGESEYGQRLVIDTVLNRVDSEHFPDSISGVIYQKNQFAAKRAESCGVDDDIVGMVYEEAADRTNTEVIFFNSVGYTKYGTALFKEGGHYFSAYKE